MHILYGMLGQYYTLTTSIQKVVLKSDVQLYAIDIFSLYANTVYH